MYPIGLDISKLTINCYIPNGQIDLIIENTEKSLNQFYSKLKKIYKKEIDQVVFIFEPTGSYSTLLKKFCGEKNIKAFIVNPKQSSNFSKAIAQRNKSDKIDAQVLSKMLSVSSADEIKIPIYNEDIQAIQDYISYYKFISKQLVQTKNHLEAKIYGQTNKQILIYIKKEIIYLEKELSKILMEIKKIIAMNNLLSKSFNNLKTIKGVGDLSAIVLLHLFLKYPDANQRQIIALSGLEPTKKESGTSVAFRPKISKQGSKILRSILFMSALSAIRFNTRIKEFYDHLKTKGKQSTVAQVAVMRKLVIIAHSLYKNYKQFIS